MKKGNLRSIISIVTGLIVLTTLHVRGDVNISWTLYGFNPDEVTINPGESVYWFNNDSYSDLVLTVQGYYPVTLPSGYYTFVTFSSVGDYEFSSDWGDYGTVHVVYPNVPPVVTITNPPNNAVFSAPATFIIGADTSDTPDDYVSYVEFYLGTSEGTNYFDYDYDVPFGTTVTNLAAGTYTLMAVAIDSHGGLGTNAITITVGNPEPIVLSTPRVSGNEFLFEVTGLTVGKTNVLQLSTTLADWVSLKTNVAVTSSATITNTPAPGPHLFRMVQWP